MIKYRLLVYGIHGEVLENKAFDTYEEAEGYAKKQPQSYNIQSYKGEKEVTKIKDRRFD